MKITIITADTGSVLYDPIRNRAFGPLFGGGTGQAQRFVDHCSLDPRGLSDHKLATALEAFWQAELARVVALHDQDVGANGEAEA